MTGVVDVMTRTAHAIIVCYSAATNEVLCSHNTACSLAEIERRSSVKRKQTVGMFGFCPRAPVNEESE